MHASHTLVVEHSQHMHASHTHVFPSLLPCPAQKNFADGPQVGFIAQQIEKYVPEVVVTGKDGYKAVQYSQLTAHLVEAVKELAQENDELRKENEELAHDYDTLVRICVCV
jgi:hypothetical protein